jgi:hypothetical protein
MKVYRLTNVHSGKSLVDAISSNIALEICSQEETLMDNYKKYTKQINKIKIGDKTEDYNWIIECLEMDELEYYMMEEFHGWD